MIRNELRLLRHDPVPAAVLVGMPLVLMTLLSDAMESTLATEGYPGAPGSERHRQQRLRPALHVVQRLQTHVAPMQIRRT